MEAFGARLIEHTFDIDDHQNVPVIIAEVKSKKDFIWLFKQNSQHGKVRLFSTGRELSKEYMYNENSDSSGCSDGEEEGLNEKYQQKDSNTIAGNFSVYFQQTMCTNEFYDIKSGDDSIFQQVEQLEANKKQKIEERKAKIVQQKQREKERKQEERQKLMEERTKEKEGPEVDATIQDARKEGKSIE